jgi:hypothetical protein
MADGQQEGSHALAPPQFLIDKLLELCDPKIKFHAAAIADALVLSVVRCACADPSNVNRKSDVFNALRSIVNHDGSGYATHIWTSTFIQSVSDYLTGKDVDPSVAASRLIVVAALASTYEIKNGPVQKPDPWSCLGWLAHFANSAAPYSSFDNPPEIDGTILNKIGIELCQIEAIASQKLDSLPAPGTQPFPLPFVIALQHQVCVLIDSVAVLKEWYGFRSIIENDRHQRARLIIHNLPGSDMAGLTEAFLCQHGKTADGTVLPYWRSG